IRDEPSGFDAECLLSPFDHRLGCANLGLADRPRRFDIHDNTELDVDEVIVGVGEERGVAQCASPLRGWVGRRDKLRHDVGRTTPCWIVEIGEVVLNGAPSPHRVDVVTPFILSPGVERHLLASAAIKLASTAKPLPPTRPALMHETTTCSKT